MITQRVVRSGVNSNVIREGYRPGEFLVSEVSNYGCRENVTIEGGEKGVAHNSVLADVGGHDVVIVFEGVKPGETALRGVIVRGPCEVSLARLVFPTVTDAVDGPDAGTDATAENAAETSALRELLIETMRSKGIVVRD